MSWDTTKIYLAQQQKAMSTLRHSLELPMEDIIGPQCHSLSQLDSMLLSRQLHLESSRQMSQMFYAMTHQVNETNRMVWMQSTLMAQGFKAMASGMSSDLREARETVSSCHITTTASTPAQPSHVCSQLGGYDP